MIKITPPSEAEAQHIGTFWVLNLDQELGTGPGREADTDPYRPIEPGREADIEPYRATGSAREADIEQEQEADTGPGRGQAPALVPLDALVPRSPETVVPRIPATFMRVGPEVAQELAQAMELDDAAVVLQRFARG